ncbi:hypothetical protein L228DRAFT_243315 [Xylona heveae TC161]|uniref:DUF6924 domain-containing protein n=1 Tax=Xylona heveae (strain CBS 132557 / TC161) TaxID=1328760 RepID=A0A165JYN5_XYLHT|nr:hypothetical protein L228DRAFT_243315 [Xylona heveae TC161]KZF26792.1 hypothetical protein L228DRAFT_243315 [Xylona heveae TC161]
MSSIPLFCTANVPGDVLSSILHEAHDWSEYLSGDKNPAIAIIKTVSMLAEPPPPCRPPITDFESQFLDKQPEELAKLLATHVPDPGLNKLSVYEFLIADTRTVEDKSVLFVHKTRSESGDNLDYVRLAASQAQIMPVAAAVGTLDAVELQRAVDEDGILRGSPPRQKGGKAPRKQLQAK